MLEIERLSCILGYAIRDLYHEKKNHSQTHAHCGAQSNCLFGRHKINRLDDTMWMRPIRWVFREEIMSVTNVVENEKKKQMGATSEKCLIWKISFGLRFTSVWLSDRFILTEIHVKRVKIWQHNHPQFHRKCFHSLRLWCNATKNEKTNKKQENKTNTRNCRNFWQTIMSNINRRKDKFPQWFMTTGWVGTPCACPQPKLF